MTTIVLLYLECSHVVWIDDSSGLDRMAKDAPPYYVRCNACSSEEPVMFWEQREVGNDVDLYNWLDKGREPLPQEASET